MNDSLVYPFIEGLIVFNSQSPTQTTRSGPLNNQKKQWSFGDRQFYFFSPSLRMPKGFYKQYYQKLFNSSFACLLVSCVRIWFVFFIYSFLASFSYKSTLNQSTPEKKTKKASMAAPWVLFLLTFLTIACFSLSSKPNAINVTNTPASSFGDDDDPLAVAASRTRSRHLNTLITSILKADAKWLFLKIFGKNEIPKVNLYKPKPPRFKFRKPDPERKRGKRFKPKKPHEESSLIKIPLFPRSFGAYSMSLRFGTPPQTMSFTLDTGDSLVWFPCTDSYRCSNCSFQNTDPTKIPTFKPEHSASSMKMVYCHSNSCGWIHGPSIKSKCKLSGPCPDYERMYGTWSTDGISIASTSGHLLLEILEESVADFLVGCSNSSTHQPLGVAGFGDAPESLPAQLELAKFSYCLLPHLYDDNTRQSTDLILDPAAELETQGLSYTRLIPGPTILSGFHFYG